MAKLAAPTIVILLALTIACSQGTETAPDVGATVDAAVAATVEAQNAVPPSTPAQMIDATLAAILASDADTFEAQSPVPPSTPTQTIDAALGATIAAAAATFEAQSLRRRVRFRHRSLPKRSMRH